MGFTGGSNGKAATILPELCSGTYAIHASDGGVVHFVSAVLADCSAGIAAGTHRLGDRYSISNRWNLPARCPGASAGCHHAAGPTDRITRIPVKGRNRQGSKVVGRRAKRRDEKFNR